MRKKPVLVLIIILAVSVSLFLSFSAAEDSGFSIKRIGQITSFGKNVFSGCVNLHRTILPERMIGFDKYTQLYMD